MIGERALITRLESANVRELVELLNDHDPQTNAALRSYYGPTLHKRLSALAFSATPQYEYGRRGKDNVVFIHDFFGGALSAMKGDGTELLWMSAEKLVDGVLGRLRLKEDGITAIRDEDRIRATGVLKLHYSEILLTLAQNYNVFAFAYDWRKHPRLAATDLDAAMTTWVGHEEDFHVVTHGSGAFVARAYMQQFGPSRAFGKHDTASCRMFMIAPPHHGSFFATQMLAGTAEVERSLAALDLRHSPSEVAEIFRSFPGLYMLLPADLLPAHQGAEDPLLKLYESATYGDARIPAHHLDAARSFHASLHDKAYEPRMLLVLGIGEQTVSGFKDLSALSVASPEDPDRTNAECEITLLGDGVLDVERGRLGQAPTRYLVGQHGALPSHPAVLAALHPFLSSGKIPDSSIDSRWSETANPSAFTAKKERGLAMKDRLNRREKSALRLLQRGIGSSPETCFTADDRAILRGSLAPFLAPQADARPTNVEALRDAPSSPIQKITVEVWRGSIADGFDTIVDPRVDAIALGHYRDAPLGAALTALDNAITEGFSVVDKDSSEPGILATLLARGIAGQEVGQILCLPDPRPCAIPRLLMIAGMGAMGKFGGPEAARLSHEVVSTAALLGKKHLVMLLIGSGEGNLPVREAVCRILQGVKDAICAHGKLGLEKITFVELKEQRVPEIVDAIRHERDILAARRRLNIELSGTESAPKENPKPDAAISLGKGGRGFTKRADPRSDATRITITREDDVYKFSALTTQASIPEREMKVSAALVEEANDGLVNATTLAEQREWGQMLGKLLLPPSFRSEVFSGPSVVFLVDAETARIHWEMIADTDWSKRKQDGAELTENGLLGGPETDPSIFLGMGRGLTRQLYTKMAPPPQPFVPTARRLRVLVVADPAEDAPLPGARAEGALVAALFQRYAELQAEKRLPSQGAFNVVEVEHLFGPAATRSELLRKLMTSSFDVLHFAGHCGRGPDGEYGWLFNKQGEVFISRQELLAVERVPSFIFANACESGVTAGRADRRSSDMAPSFAEAFFQCGVSNFVCTAWPIDDEAARLFALTFYTTLLGLHKHDEDSPEPSDAFAMTSYTLEQGSPDTIQQAMKKARETIAGPRSSTTRAPDDDDPFDPDATDDDARTWGAYQHYGDPSFRLFR